MPQLIGVLARLSIHHLIIGLLGLYRQDMLSSVLTIAVEAVMERNLLLPSKVRLVLKITTMLYLWRTRAFPLAIWIKSESPLAVGAKEDTCHSKSLSYISSLLGLKILQRINGNWKICSVLQEFSCRTSLELLTNSLISLFHSLAVTRPDFNFKAAICGAGISDWDTMCLASDVPSLEAQFVGGTPWENDYKKTDSRHGSPIWHMKDAKTPILILRMW